MKNNKRILIQAIMILIIISLAACDSNSNTNPNEIEFGSISGRLYFDENSNQVCDCDCGIEEIKIRLYTDKCGGTFQQTAISNEEGYYTFSDLKPGSYCIFPDIPFSCEGFTPTTGINRTIEVTQGETVEVEWFSYEIYLELGNN